ncbi:transmembrane protein, putative [Bodo saltans]|uniref:Transmembrane protein, putative n=1 Tax=Bodo saltans TaxID=75058 RepID=A0A0S4J7J6_BODSA|nr:transmembrane protein, putative [Bodo saltans]|eukprot:CUG86163.1 transmembrane protein, putative [Bodo saltans]
MMDFVLSSQRRCSVASAAIVVCLVCLLSLNSTGVSREFRHAQPVLIPPESSNPPLPILNRLLPETIELDRVDVADAADVSISCRIGRHYDETGQPENPEEDIVTYGACLDRCTAAEDCVAATFLASRDSMLRQREDLAHYGPTMPSPIPIFTRAEQLSLRSGRCRILQCHQDEPPEEEAIAMSLQMIKRSKQRRAAVQPVTSWVRPSLVLRHFLSPPSVVEITFHFLMISSLLHLHTRMLPALGTWARGQRVSLFLDAEGSGLEKHQEEDAPIDITNNAAAVQVVFAAGKRYRCNISIFNVSRLEAPSSADPMLWLRRRSINGAWKPLVMLAAWRQWRTVREEGVAPPFIVLVDDDTFMNLGNLRWHLETLRIGRHAVCGACSFALGGHIRFTRLISQKNFAPPSRPELSTLLPMSMTSLDYLQGGGGIVMTTPFVEDFVYCLEQLFAEDNASHRRNDADVFIISKQDAHESISTANVTLPTEFADQWPAGDMRLAWAARECRRMMPGWSNQSSARMLLLDEPALSHRSLELSLGADRRHWVAGFPASFHRSRHAEDFDRLHDIVGDDITTTTESPPSLTSWGTVESRAATWWQTKLLATTLRHQQLSASRRAEVSDDVRRMFFDDEGFA